MPVRALITGAGGFVGAALARRMLADGHQLTLAVRPGSDQWRLRGLRSELTVIEADLRDSGEISQLIADAKPEAILHLAAHGAYSWQQDGERMLETNLLGTVRLLEASAAAGVGRFVHAGSSSEYGFRDHAPTEEEAPQPNGDYAASKAAATTYCGLYGRERGIETVTLRLYSVYGPWEHPDRLIPTLVRAARAGELPPLVDPDTGRDFVFVDDACDAFELAATCDLPRAGAVYNVASGRQTSLRELVELAREVFGVEVAPRWGSMERRAWDTDVWVGDPGLIGRELGWHPTTTLDQGLRETARWVEDVDGSGQRR